jgi:hypothetical protein
MVELDSPITLPCGTVIHPVHPITSPPFVVNDTLPMQLRLAGIGFSELGYRATLEAAISANNRKLDSEYFRGHVGSAALKDRAAIRKWLDDDENADPQP